MRDSVSCYLVKRLDLGASFYQLWASAFKMAKCINLDLTTHPESRRSQNFGLFFTSTNPVDARKQQEKSSKSSPNFRL